VREIRHTHGTALCQSQLTLDWRETSHASVPLAGFRADRRQTAACGCPHSDRRHLILHRPPAIGEDFDYRPHELPVSRASDLSDRWGAEHAVGVQLINEGRVALVEDLFGHPSNECLVGFEHGSFWNYATMCVLTLLFAWKVTQESKGQTLEEIEWGLGLPEYRRTLHLR
jgi:hypothetical protein